MLLDYSVKNMYAHPFYFNFARVFILISSHRNNRAGQMLSFYLASFSNQPFRDFNNVLWFSLYIHTSSDNVARSAEPGSHFYSIYNLDVLRSERSRRFKYFTNGMKKGSNPCQVFKYSICFHGLTCSKA